LRILASNVRLILRIQSSVAIASAFLPFGDEYGEL
jgi:hypothetical protein